MKREEVEYYLDKLPIKIWAKDGTVITVIKLIEKSDSSISILDKFNSKWTIEFNDISKINEINNIHSSKEIRGGKNQ